jgi:hypothetical protein
MSPILNSFTPISSNQPSVSLCGELSSWLVNFVCRQRVVNLGNAQQSQQLPDSSYDATDTKGGFDERTIEQLLEHAKQKLSTPQMPHFMRVTVYLRYCCLAIQKSLSEEHQALVSNVYHDLLQWLWECEPNWWEQCFITDTGRIVSPNLHIQDLLQPLEDFVSQFSEA